MEHKKVKEMIEELGIPYAYDHFAEGESPKPPFVIFYYPRTSNFAADGIAYFKKNVLNVEVYTDEKDIELEERIEAVFERHGLFFVKTEVWIESEKLYEVLYEMEV